MKAYLEEICQRIYAGGDVPKDRFSLLKTDEYSIPIFANAEADEGLYGFTDIAREFSPAVTVAARGTIGYTAIRTEPFLPVVRLITLVPDLEKVTLKYLYYALRNYKTTSSGTSIPQLTVPVIKKYSLPLCSISEQQSITDTLDKICRIIDLRKSEISAIDDLIKARFVEMFGVPGEDTESWGKKALGECCIINPKQGSESRLSAGMIVSFVPMSAVSEKGEINTSEVKKYDEVRTGFTYFAENDVLFAKITPCMENGKGAVAKGLCNGIGFGSTEFHVLRPLQEISNPYWIYLLTSFQQFRQDAAENMTGSAGQRRVPAAFLERYKVALPPIELQNQFASFVAQVNQSKCAVQKALDEAQTLFDSLMQQYFG